MGAETGITSERRVARRLRSACLCKTVPSAIAVTYKSSVPLRTLVGPRLQVGVAFSTKDSAGEPVAFSYHKG
jgi:hypothetical protein